MKGYPNSAAHLLFEGRQSQALGFLDVQGPVPPMSPGAPAHYQNPHGLVPLQPLRQLVPFQPPSPVLAKGDTQGAVSRFLCAPLFLGAGSMPGLPPLFGHQPLRVSSVPSLLGSSSGSSNSQFLYSCLILQLGCGDSRHQTWPKPGLSQTILPAEGALKMASFISALELFSCFLCPPLHLFQVLGLYYFITGLCHCGQPSGLIWSTSE